MSQTLDALGAMNANTVTRSVDVLNVMDDAAQDYEGELSCPSLGADMREARAAVAELVEAAKAINVAITCGGHEARINRSNPLSVETLRAVLAKFGELK